MMDIETTAAIERVTERVDALEATMQAGFGSVRAELGTVRAELGTVRAELGRELGTVRASLAAFATAWRTTGATHKCCSSRFSTTSVSWPKAWRRSARSSTHVHSSAVRAAARSVR